MTPLEVKPGYWVVLNPKKAIYWKDLDHTGIALDAFTPKGMIAQIPEGPENHIECDRRCTGFLHIVEEAVRLGRLKLSARKPKLPGLDFNKKDVDISSYLNNPISVIKKMVEEGKFQNTEIESLLSIEVSSEKPRKTLVKYLSGAIKEYASELAIGVLSGGKEGMDTNWQRKRIKKDKRPLKNEPKDTDLANELIEEQKEAKSKTKRASHSNRR